VLGNLANRDDAVRLSRKLRRGQVKRVIEKVRVRGPGRDLVRGAEADPSLEKVQRDETPAVRRRWLTVGTDSSEVPFPEHVACTWLAGRPGLRVSSPGCGTGVWEIAWARLGAFGNITGIAISPEQIGRATWSLRSRPADPLEDLARGLPGGTGVLTDRQVPGVSCQA
jgi:hypothetical protein